ncbi:MAG: alpha/beta hydrolase [Prevotella sp.]
MKTKILFFLLSFSFALTTAVMTACSDDDDDDEKEFVTDPGNDNDGSSGAGNEDNGNGGGGGNQDVGTDGTLQLVKEELSCDRDGYNIYGVMYRKVRQGAKVPCVILSHSSSLTHEAMAGYADSIAEKGMAAYCFDFCGACDESKSDGSTDEMTVFTEVDDLKAVIKKIKTLDYVDTDSIFLLGSSQGGLVSALVAEDLSADIRGMILFYPAFNIPELVKMFSGFSGSFGNLGDILGNLGGFGGMMSTSEAFVESIKDFDVWSNIGTYPNPVLILHGTNDFFVPISNSEKAVELYPDATLVRIEGANHGFNDANLGGYGSMTGEYDDVVMPYVYSFLNR